MNSAILSIAQICAHAAFIAQMLPSAPYAATITTGSATKAYEWAKTVLSNYMSSVAVMLVTTIAIPILMLFCFLWLVKFLTKRDFVIAVVGYADRMAESTRQRLMPKKRNLPRETDRP